MSIQQSTELIIFVTHVEADGSLLKIWGQVDKNSATCVERMILPLVEQFARSQGCVGSQSSNLRANALCCARFQNEGYYRAKVVNVRADGMVVLQFIDYGNVEILPPQEIHLLENIPGSESLQSFPPVAFEFTLMHVLPVNGVWENKIVESIKKILWYNEYKILIHTVVNNHLFIKLWYNNEDFSELMVNKRMAVRATLQEMFRSKCVQQVPIYPQPTKHVISNNCAPIQPLNPLRCETTYQRQIPACCAAQQKHMMQSSVHEALVFKSRVLDVPSKHDVFVSCVEDGPQKFSVQLQSTTQILSQLMRDINSHSIEPLQEPPLPGSVCLGRYTRDKVLCRAVVMSVMENKCKLYYVDFGHTEVLPYTDIFQLPPHFISPKVLSIRFTLSGVNELNVTEEMKKYFKQIVSGKLLVLHVRPPEGPPLVQYGDLYDDGKNIKDILRHAFPVPVPAKSLKLHYAAEKKLGKGMEEMVHVSFVESCRKFFVQLESNVKSLEMIMDSLAEFCNTAPSLSCGQLGVGLACAALYDSQWYRGQILDMLNSDTVKVLYVDYGNKETLPISSLRAIREDLIKNLPAQAIRCTLNGWELLPCTQELQNQFESLILEKRLRLRVVEAHSENMMVDLFEPEKNESIKSRMLHAIRGENEAADHQEAESPAKMVGKVNQRCFAELQLNSVQQRNNRIDVEATRCENKWQKKPSPDSWHQNNQSDRSKYKTWKDESNEEKLHDSRLEKPSNSYHRFNRDEFQPTRRTNRQESDNFKSPRGGNRIASRPKISTFTPKSHSSDKSWSDKDSDTSSRGGNRRGRGGNRGYRRESSRSQTNKQNDRDSDGSFKSTKPSFDSHHGGGRFKERRGQGHRLSQNKLNLTSSSSEGEKRRFNPMRSLKIPRCNLILGEIKQCEVVFTNSCLDFFVQLSADFGALDSVMENIATVYENGGDGMKDGDIVGGSYCVARYSEDQRWYRAVINSVAEKSAVVQFVDYGNTETVPFERIKSMQKQFVQLPVQAIRCKLLGAKDDPINTKTFEDLVAGKNLEVEFISEENSTYVVLLKEDSGRIINEEFSGGIDLTKAKEEAKKDKFCTANAKSSVLTDYVSPDFDWSIVKYTNETKKDVIITWFTNPNNFYCQILDNEGEFRTMMNEIQKIYVGREPISNNLRIGSPVIAIFAEDGALYRAEILELNKLNGHLVQYVDFGNSAVVNARKIYPVEKRVTTLPKQAVQCTLRNIVPKDENGWSKVDTKEIDACFNADKYECVFHDVNEEKYVVTLVNERINVAEMLVEKSLAAFSCDEKIKVEESSAANVICDVEKVDINLLPGQTIRVKVSSFENAGKFYVQLPSAVECQNIINAYMAEKNAEVMQRLSSREISLGTGCLVCSNGVWRRAAVEIGSRPRCTSGFHVKFIDTGAFDEIHSDSVLALPGELSAMQNQAVECSVVSNINGGVDSLKEIVEGKEVIMYVDEVDNNRLLVHLYDTCGHSLTEASPSNISPICPMPILTSTHKVMVSFADHSSSVWLQRYSDHTLDQNLMNSLDQHYSTPKNPIEPKENLICAVKSCDGHWYRAQILNETETSVCVKFIDYGNNEQVSRDVIMSLDSCFYVPHRLAINVSLPVTLNGTVNEQLNVLQNYLSNRELTGVFRNVDKKWIVELLSDGEKISDKFRALNLVSNDEDTNEGPLFIHKMSVGEKYEVYVSHIDSPSQFWLQRVEDAADLSRKQDDLQVEAPDFPKLDGILEEGSLCAAVYTIDNLWYRAEVIDADEDITTVRFVDYGNTDIIDNKTGNIRLIPDSWRSLPEYSIKCRLDIIPMDSEDWPTATCEKFESLITSVESLQATIIANNVPKRVDLIIDDKSVSEILVEEKHAIKVHTEEELIDEIVDLELDPHSAFVSHINSPDEFWVQEEKSVGNLEIMSDRFIMADMFDKVDNVEEGLLCVAKYPEDKCWYRARVISTNDDSTRVIYIDYGNSAISTEIRAIPSDLADIPPLSRKCRLNIPEGVKEWSDKACEEFVTLAADGATIFLLDVLKEDETSVVKLTLDGKNVSDILASFCESSLIIEERLPPLGEENSPNIFIIRVNSPSDFWIQTENNSTELNLMLDKLQSASTFLPLCSVEIGLICAAIFKEDEQWYRAKILRILEHDSVEVLFIDYGNVAIADEFRSLPLDIINIGPLAKRCALQKPEEIKDWSLEACKRFEELAAGGEAMFQLEILDDVCEPVCVKLSFQGRNVVDCLLNKIEENTIAKQENEDEYNADISGFVEDVENNRSFGDEKEAEKSEFLEENVENGSFGEEKEAEKSGSSVLELSVDEIVQNMKKEEFEEEVETVSKDLSESRSGNIEEESGKVEEIEAESEKIEEIEAESEKIEDFEGQNGERGNLGAENDGVEDLEGGDDEKGDLEACGEKIEDFEAEESEKGANIELQSVEKENIELQSGEKENIELQSEERANIELQSEERANIELQSEERANIELQSGERANIELQSEERANIESQSEEKANIESRSAKVEEKVESKSVEMTNVECKSVEIAEVESGSEKSAEIESKSVEIADIDSKSLEIGEIESKSAEIAEIECKSVESVDIGSGSENIAEIECKGAEMDKNMELQSVEVANIECKSVEVANIESGSEKSAEIESKSVEIAENESRSTEIESRSEKNTEIESKSVEITENESRGEKSAEIESRGEKSAEIESKSEEITNIESKSAEIESRSEKSAEIESKSVEIAENESRSTEIESRSEKSTEIESKSVEIAEIESKSEEITNIESKSAEIESGSEKSTEIESKSVKIAEIDSRSSEITNIESKSTEIESRSEKLTNIESTSAEIPNIESRSEKRADIESKSAEIESRSEKLTNIESKSSEITNIESTSEKLTNIESKTSEIPNIESRSEKLTNIESKSSEITNIESPITEVTKLDSKSTTEEVLSNATKEMTLETNPKASSSSFESNSNSTTEEKNEAKCVEITEDSSISSKEDCETRETIEPSSKNEECERIKKEDA